MRSTRTWSRGTRAGQLTIPAKRGTIYDRSGTVVLAETVDRYRLVANLHDLTTAERQRYGDLLVDYLELDAGPASDLRKILEGKGYYVPLASNVDATTAQDISAAQATRPADRRSLSK